MREQEAHFSAVYSHLHPLGVALFGCPKAVSPSECGRGLAARQSQASPKRPASSRPTTHFPALPASQNKAQDSKANTSTTETNAKDVQYIGLQYMARGCLRLSNGSKDNGTNREFDRCQTRTKGCPDECPRLVHVRVWPASLQPSHIHL